MPLARRFQLERRAVLAAAAFGLLRPALAPARAAELPVGGLELSFEDRFAALSLYHPTVRPQGRWKTNYEFGNPQDYGHASSRSLPREKQIYVDPVEHGIDPFSAGPEGLAIIARRNDHLTAPRFCSTYGRGLIPQGRPFAYTSGLLTTERSFSQTYGYFEARMAFPRGRGFWPAFWLLPSRRDYLHGDEVDVVEWVGVNPSRLVFAAHGEGNGGGNYYAGFPDRDRFHDYGLLWTRTSLRWYVDGRLVRAVRNHKIHKPMHLLVNLAIGGWDGNDREDVRAFPGVLRVAQIRAYRLPRA